MEDNRPQLPDPGHSAPRPRKYVYRSVEPESGSLHPMRRSTDIPHPFQATGGQICPGPMLFKFRVYLKIN